MGTLAPRSRFPCTIRGQVDALVLAAGFGTRMGTRPKAFLPVGGSTAIDRLVDATREAGIDRAIVVRNSRWTGTFTRWTRARHGTTPAITDIDDGARDTSGRLGAVADLRLGLEAADGDVLLLPVDNVLTWPLRRFVDRAAGVDPALTIRTMRRGYEALGAVDVDASGVVQNLYDRVRPGGGRPWAKAVWLGPAFIPAGVAPLAVEYCEDERSAGRRPDSLGEFFGWLARRMTVRAHLVDEGEAWDVGTPSGLSEAQRVLGP